MDKHPWNTLLTMKEVLKLEPGSVRFIGPDSENHAHYWRVSIPDLVDGEKHPIFVLDTQAIHPHQVESEPRRPFRPWL